MRVKCSRVLLASRELAGVRASYYSVKRSARKMIMLWDFFRGAADVLSACANRVRHKMHVHTHNTLPLSAWPTSTHNSTHGPGVRVCVCVFLYGLYVVCAMCPLADTKFLAWQRASHQFTHALASSRPSSANVFIHSENIPRALSAIHTRTASALANNVHIVHKL